MSSSVMGRRLPMDIHACIPLLDDVLAAWTHEIGRDYPGYRNHVYRMVHFSFALRDCTDDERRKVVIAGCFHDLGLWSDGTVDYLPPSIERAKAYLVQHRLERWSREIELMIATHHKLRRYQDDRYPLVEVFRRADLVDVSLGLLKCGVPGAYIRRVKEQFPNEGFHRRLAQLVGGWVARHPTRPLPFFRW